MTPGTYTVTLTADDPGAVKANDPVSTDTATVTVSEVSLASIGFTNDHTMLRKRGS